MNESIQENIKGIRVVKSYVRDEYEEQKFKMTSDDVRNDFLKGEKIIALANPLMQFCVWFSILMICFLVPMIGVGTDGGKFAGMSPERLNEAKGNVFKTHVAVLDIKYSIFRTMQIALFAQYFHYTF